MTRDDLAVWSVRIVRRIARVIKAFFSDFDYSFLLLLFAVVIWLLLHIHENINEIGIAMGLDW